MVVRDNETELVRSRRAYRGIDVQTGHRELVRGIPTQLDVGRTTDSEDRESGSRIYHRLYVHMHIYMCMYVVPMIEPK